MALGSGSIVNQNPTGVIDAVSGVRDFKVLGDRYTLWARQRGKGIFAAVRPKIKKFETNMSHHRVYYKDSWFVNSTLVDDASAASNYTPTDFTPTVTVDDSAMFAEGMLVSNLDQNEQMRVTEIVSSTQVKVLRSTTLNGGDSLQTWANNDTIAIVHQALDEDSGAADQLITEVASYDNRMSNYSRPVMLTERAELEALKTGSLLVERREEADQKFADDMDSVALHGKQFETASSLNGLKTVSASRGIIQVVRQLSPALNLNENITGMTTATMKSLILKPSLRYGSMNKMALCGQNALERVDAVISADTNSSINLSVGQSDYGLEVMKLRAVYGGGSSLDLFHYKSFDELFGGFFTNYMLVLDMADIQLWHMPGYANPKYLDVPKTTNRIKTHKEWVAFEAYNVKEPRRHAMFKLVS